MFLKLAILKDEATERLAKIEDTTISEEEKC